VTLAVEAQCHGPHCARVRKYAGVTQKYLVVTANYPARARGVGKLMGIVEVRETESFSDIC